VEGDRPRGVTISLPGNGKERRRKSVPSQKKKKSRKSPSERAKRRREAERRSAHVFRSQNQPAATETQGGKARGAIKSKEENGVEKIRAREEKNILLGNS